MNLGTKAAAMMVLGVAAIAGGASALGSTATPADAFGNPRIVVNVAGPQAGTVDFENIPADFLPDLLTNEDTGDVLMPTNYCGLNIEYVGGIYWYDASNHLIEAENHGEITYYNNAYRFMGEDVTDAYLGGMEFTGALDTCDSNEPWYFPIPLSYGGNAPQYGAAKLVLELDQPPSFQPSIEFLDSAHEPMELPDLYEDWEPPADWDEYCEKVPEFCEPKVNPDLVPLDLDFSVLFGCWTLGTCDNGDSLPPELGLTLGCLNYSIGCDPDPQPPTRLTLTPDPAPTKTVSPQSVQLSTR